jgi:Myb/SANT-like DNA-binding protein
MPRAARVRRAPNREPVSLAAAIPISDVVEAVDPVAAVDAHIDPALMNDNLYSAPTPLISKEYPPFNDANDEYIYPLPPIPPSPPIPSREITWSPTPPPLPPPPIETVIINDDLQPQPPFKWTLEMEGLLFYTLLEQANSGKRADSGFKKEAWIACCLAIKAVTTQLITVDKCKAKADAMKALWKEFTWLRDQSGFGYNEETGLITAGETAWRDVIKVSNTIKN